MYRKDTKMFDSTEDASQKIDARIVQADFDRLHWSAGLREVTRFLGQRYWEAESLRHIRNHKSFGAFRLENVAEHSWHLSDAVIVIGPRFPKLNVGKATILATVHDLLEVVTGDYDPIGTGSGLETHAFSSSKGLEKQEAEFCALDGIKERFEKCSKLQFEMIDEYLRLSSDEACFVKALDKIQVLILVHHYKMEAGIEREHLAFAKDYCGAQIDKNFPGLRPYLDHMLRKLEDLPIPQETGANV